MDKVDIIVFSLVVVLTLVVTLLMLGICISGSIATPNTDPVQPSTTDIPTLIEGRSYTYPDGIFVYIDPQTGVNYLIYSSKNPSTGAGLGGMCPRYNADGTLYISEVTS
jgi:hypothetical protein